MAALTIRDLHMSRALDLKAMSSIKGASGAWVFGWIRPYVRSAPGIFGESQVVNYFQINNYYADQMNNQIQMINLSNMAPNSNVTLSANQLGMNNR